MSFWLINAYFVWQAATWQLWDNCCDNNAKHERKTWVFFDWSTLILSDRLRLDSCVTIVVTTMLNRTDKQDWVFWLVNDYFVRQAATCQLCDNCCNNNAKQDRKTWVFWLTNAYSVWQAATYQLCDNCCDNNAKQDRKTWVFDWSTLILSDRLRLDNCETIVVTTMLNMKEKHEFFWLINAYFVRQAAPCQLCDNCCDNNAKQDRQTGLSFFDWSTIILSDRLRLVNCVTIVVTTMLNRTEKHECFDWPTLILSDRLRLINCVTIVVTTMLNRTDKHEFLTDQRLFCLTGCALSAVWQLLWQQC